MEFKDVIPWIFSLGMFIIALVTLARNGKKDMKAEYVEESSKIHEIEQSLTRIDTKLDNLQNTMQDTRKDVKTANSGYQELDKRLSKMETEFNTMWKRYDELKGKVEHYHEGN